MPRIFQVMRGMTGPPADLRSVTACGLRPCRPQAGSWALEGAEVSKFRLYKKSSLSNFAVRSILSITAPAPRGRFVAAVPLARVDWWWPIHA
jgi:hypothetical protein